MRNYFASSGWRYIFGSYATFINVAVRPYVHSRIGSLVTRTPLFGHLHSTREFYIRSSDRDEVLGDVTLRELWCNFRAPARNLPSLDRLDRRSEIYTVNFQSIGPVYIRPVYILFEYVIELEKRRNSSNVLKTFVAGYLKWQVQLKKKHVLLLLL